MRREMITLLEPSSSSDIYRALECLTIHTERGWIRKENDWRPLHTHPYWQADMVANNSFEAEADGELFDMKQGDCLLIPPECEHGFAYPVGAQYLSFKFHIRRFESPQKPRLANRSDVGHRLCMLLNDIVPDSGNPVGLARSMVDHLLATLVIHNYMPSEKSGRSKRNAFSSAIMSFVRQYGGKRITVQEVARAIALKNILQVVS